MGMSKGQKQRLYGDRAGASAWPPKADSTSRRPGGQRGGPDAEGATGRSPQAEPAKKSSAGIITGVLVVVSILMVVYLHASLLPRLGASAHTTVPELDPFGFVSDAPHIARSLGDAGRNAYVAIHWSWGLISPIFLGAAWFAMVAASGIRGRRRTALWIPPLVFVVLTIAGNLTVDAALSDPAGAWPGLAAGLVVARWFLLVIMVAEAVWLAVRLVRGKLDAFSRGELEGQQPRR